MAKREGRGTSTSRTIREYVTEAFKLSQRHLVERLTALEAPAVVLDHAAELLAKVERDGLITVKGDQALLDRTFSAVGVRKGRGGKEYLQFTTAYGAVNYFPNARWGRFVKEVE